MKLSDIVKKPEDKWPFKRLRGYLSLKSSLANFELPENTKPNKVSASELHRIYSIRARNGAIDGIDDFLETLGHQKLDAEILGFGFDSAKGFFFVILDEGRNYLTHIVKQR